MSEELFILCQDDFGNYEIRHDEEVFHFLWEVAPILNEQQAIIRRDEISIKTMMSNMEKLEEENEQLRKENVFLAYWKRKAMTLLMQVRRLTSRMTDKEVREFSRELEDE